MKKRQSFRHIRDSDRDRIQALRDRCHSQKEIAEVLGFSESAISRELDRSPTRVGRYVADRASAHSEEKRSHSKYPGMKIEAYPEMRRFIIHALKKLRSPDEIAGRLKKNGVMPRIGKNAIYKWLYSDAGQPYCRYLCTKRSRNLRQSGMPKRIRSEEHTSELQSQFHLVCRLLLEKKRGTCQHGSTQRRVERRCRGGLGHLPA